MEPTTPAEQPLRDLIDTLVAVMDEEIRLRHGDRVDMADSFADRGLDELMRLTVGDVLDDLAAGLARGPDRES